jgi:HAMP domain-containing protein
MIAALTLFPIVFVLIAAVIYLRAVSRLQRASEQSDNG